MNGFQTKFIIHFIVYYIFFMAMACDMNHENDKEILQENKIQLNLSTDKLPINFNGDNIEELITKLNNERPQKSVYETIEEYKKKLEINYNSLLRNETVYFIRYILDESIGKDDTLSYDAEVEKYLLEIKASRGVGDIDNKEFPFLLIKKDTISTTYVGQNAFGAKITINLQENTVYQIALINFQDLFKNGDKFKKHFIYWFIKDIYIPKDRAKKYSLNILFVVRSRPVGPLYDPKPSGSKLSGSMYDYRLAGGGFLNKKEPTFNHPYDERFSNKYFFAELLENAYCFYSV